MHCSGYKTAQNVGTYFGRMYEPRYLSGIVAGKMTKSDIIGYVAAFPIPEVIRGINAFTLGVRSVNPKAKVHVMWIKIWYNPGIERDIAEKLLDNGADVLAMHQDSPATLQAAERRGKYVIGYNTDMKMFAPNAYLTAPIWNWGVVYRNVANAVYKKIWKSEEIWWGMDKDVVQISQIRSTVPKDVIKLIEIRKSEIVNKNIHVFSGPIKDQNGAMKVHAGKNMSDFEMLQMNFFVQGVEGVIPEGEG